MFGIGDLVYSLAYNEFYIILSIEGDMCFIVYTMDGDEKLLLDITLVNIYDLDELPSNLE